MLNQHFCLILVVGKTSTFVFVVVFVCLFTTSMFFLNGRYAYTLSSNSSYHNAASAKKAKTKKHRTYTTKHSPNKNKVQRKHSPTKL